MPSALGGVGDVAPGGSLSVGGRIPAGGKGPDSSLRGNQ